MRTLATVAAWLLLLASIALVALYRAPSLDPDATSFRHLRVYPLESPVRFAIEPREQRVKLLTWLRAPESWGGDARDLRPYALGLRFTNPDGEEAWATTIWLAARPGVLEERDGRLIKTARSVDEPSPTGLAISAENLTMLPLHDLADLGGVLTVESAWLPAGSELLLCGWRQGARAASGQVRALRPEADDDWQEQVESWSPTPWQLLPTSWRARLVRSHWDRLSALPDAGKDVVDTVEIEAAFGRVPLGARAAMGIVVAPGGAAAWNLRSGSQLNIEVLTLDGLASAPVDAQLRLVHTDGRVELRALPAVSAIGPLQIDEGIVSVQVALAPNEAAPRLLRAWLQGDGGAPWGDPSLAMDAVRGERQVGVDLRTLDLVRVAPDLEPARFSVAAGEQLRLGFRERLPAADLPGFGPRVPEPGGATVDIEGLGPDGEVLEAWQVELSPLPSSFERYISEDDLRSARVAEPERWTLVLAEGVRTLQVAASATVEVELEVLRVPAGVTLLPPGYAWETGASASLVEVGAKLRPRLPGDPVALHGARYEPRARTEWERRVPDDVDSLFLARRIVRVDAQVRLEPTWATERALSPVGSDGRRSGRLDEHSLPLGRVVSRLAEPDWDGLPAGGARTRLTATPTTVMVPATGRLDIDMRVPPDQVGRTVQIQLDDHQEERLIAASGAQLRLVDLPPGRGSLSLRGASGLFLAVAPGGRLWQTREVVRLDPGERLRIPIGDLPGSLSVYSYGPPAALSWWIEGAEPLPPGLYDNPSTRSGVVSTAPTGRLAEPLSFAGAALPVARPLRIHLDEDLGEQATAVWIERTDQGGALWVRATASWALPPRPKDRSTAVGGAR